MAVLELVVVHVDTVRILQYPVAASMQLDVVVAQALVQEKCAMVKVLFKFLMHVW